MRHPAPLAGLSSDLPRHYDGFAFWLRQFFGQIIYFSVKAAFVYSFVGAALRLLDFPAERMVPASAPDSSSTE